MEWQVEYYKMKNGNIPVLDYLLSLDAKLRAKAFRIFYFTYRQNTFVLLHGFTKKTEITPQKELERALRYKEDYERRCDDE